MHAGGDDRSPLAGLSGIDLILDVWNDENSAVCVIPIQKKLTSAHICITLYLNNYDHICTYKMGFDCLMILQ